MSQATELELNDPHELLEIYTPDGRPTGAGASRAEVHLSGLWHCAFYCWVARPGRNGPEILLQHRSSSKDTNPDFFGASCAGHVRLAEPMSEAVRELEEELGLAEPLENLLEFGTHSEECVHPNGLIDREHHALYLLARPIADSELHPGPSEVQGVAWMPASDLLRLVDDSNAAATVAYLGVNSGSQLQPSQRRIQGAEIVPYQHPYYHRLVDVATAELRRKGIL